MPEHKRLYFISFFEKFTINGLRSILILYAMRQLGMNEHNALECIGAALGMGFITPLLGGFLADYTHNPKMVILLGLSFMVISTIILFFSHGLSNQYFLFCLTFMILGTGLVRSNVPTLLGNFQKNTKQDLFTEYYIYLNIGSLLGVVGCGLVAEIYGWKIGFMLAICASLTALGFAATISSHYNKKLVKNNLDYFKYILLIGCALLLSYLCIIEVNFYNIINTSLLLFIVYYLIFVVYRKQAVSKKDFFKLIVLGASHLIFLALYEQGSYSLIIFIERYVDRNIPLALEPLNILKLEVIPTSAFQLIDPLLNILLGKAILALWVFIERKNLKIEPYIKFIIGLIVVVLAFTFLNKSISEFNSITYIHIIFLYVLFVIAELCIIPTGMAFVSKIAPENKKSLFMGLWLMGMGFSQWLALNLAKIATTPDPDQACVSIINYKYSFLMFAYMALGVMVALIIAKLIDNIYLKKTGK